MSDQHEQRKPEEIESDIKQHRERLDDTLGQMEERFSPEKLVNSAFDYVRHGGANEFASNLSGTIKNNPTPFLVASIGLGWLFWSQRNGGQHASSSNMPNRRYDPYATSTAGEAMAADDLTSGMPNGTQGTDQSYAQAQPHTSGHTAGAGGKARHMSDSVKDRTHAMSHGLHDRASRFSHGSRDTMHGASDRAHNASHQTAEFIREHPVMAGAIGIAIGAALGGILPSTRTEDQRLGGLRDKAIDRASQEGERYADEARGKVHEKTEQQNSAGQDSRQGGTGSHETDSHETGSRGTGPHGAGSHGAGSPGSNSHEADSHETSGSRGTLGSAGTGMPGVTAEEIDKGQTAVPPTATTPGSAKEATDSNPRPTPLKGGGMHSDDPRSDGNDR